MAVDESVTRDSPDPLFVGGTGRSGTTIVGALVGAHPWFYAPPFELRLHTENVPPLIEGRQTLERFEDRVWNTLFHTRHRPVERGISLGVDEQVMSAALAAFKASYVARPHEAARVLVRALMDPPAQRGGARAWVETTPNNTQRAAWLLELFPQARFIHVVRNGLDVACSVATQPWGPDEAELALEWWEVRLRAAHAGLAEVPPDRVLTLQYEELVRDRRRETYSSLVDFLGVPDDPGMRRFFEDRMPPTNLLRWRTDLPPDRAERLRLTYEDMLVKLAADGVIAPGPRAHLGSTDGGEDGAA